MTRVQVHRGIAIWSSGLPDAPVDVWFHPAFGDSRLSYRHAFGSTLNKFARIWAELIARFSKKRRVVLVGHSMAGIVASETARRLARPPTLVIGVEANLTAADAYFTGLAARFDAPEAFHAALRSRIWRAARRDEAIRQFACSLEFADPMTLWTLGRSVFARRDAGAAFRRLRCPKIHYYDATGCPRQTRDYLVRHDIPRRRLDYLGHWPMVRAPAKFYAAVRDDICKAAPP